MKSVSTKDLQCKNLKTTLRISGWVALSAFKESSNVSPSGCELFLWAASSSFFFKFLLLLWWWWWWPWLHPLAPPEFSSTYLTNFSTIRNSTIPAVTYRKTMAQPPNIRSSKMKVGEKKREMVLYEVIWNKIHAYPQSITAPPIPKQINTSSTL